MKIAAHSRIDPSSSALRRVLRSAWQLRCFWAMVKSVMWGIRVYFPSFLTMKNRRRPENPAAFLEKDNAVQIKRGRSRPYMLQTNYYWCIYRDKANRGESVGHACTYQHSWDPYSCSPAIHLALSSPHPVCLPIVWPIVTESNCRQKTTSNDYFICTFECQGAAASEKSQTGTFNKRTRPPFLFPTHNFRQQRILLTWLRLEHQNKWQSAARGQSAQRRERITGTTWCQPVASSFLLPLIKSMLQVETTIEDKQRQHNVEAPFNVNSFILKSPLMSKHEKKEEQTSDWDTGVARKEKRLCVIPINRETSSWRWETAFFFFFLCTMLVDYISFIMCGPPSGLPSQRQDAGVTVNTIRPGQIPSMGRIDERCKHHNNQQSALVATATCSREIKCVCVCLDRQEKKKNKKTDAHTNPCTQM